MPPRTATDRSSTWSRSIRLKIPKTIAEYSEPQRRAGSADRFRGAPIVPGPPPPSFRKSGQCAGQPDEYLPPLDPPDPCVHLCPLFSPPRGCSKPVQPGLVLTKKNLVSSGGRQASNRGPKIHTTLTPFANPCDERDPRFLTPKMHGPPTQGFRPK